MPKKKTEVGPFFGDFYFINSSTGFEHSFIFWSNQT